MASTLNGTGVTFSNGTAQPTAANVRQIVSTSKTDAATMTGSTPTDVSGMSVTITPYNSSSRILVIVNIALDGYNHINLARLLRDGTVINNSTAGSTANGFYAHYGFGSDTGMEIGTTTYLDSPATASAVTYKVQVWNSSGGTTYVNRTVNGGYGAVSSITVVELLA